MALQNTDLFIVQDPSDNTLHKTTLEAISQFVQLDDIGLVYRGTADFTAQMTGQLNPATPTPGDFYVNTGFGSPDSSWVGLPALVNVGDFAIYNATSTEWDYIAQEAQIGGQVDGITATLPIKVDTTVLGSETNPNLTIDDATSTVKGVVERLAVAADVLATNVDPSTTAVVTANLLKATNAQVAINTQAIADGGGGTGGGIGEAPQDGKCYVRQDAAWVDASTKYVVKNFSSYPELP